MRLLKIILICFPVVFAGFVSCTKTTTIHQFETDTVVIKQHLTLNDTFYNLTNDITAWYSFNLGSLYDSSGWNNNISVCTATPTADRFGRPGNAYHFDGTQFMNVNAHSSVMGSRYITVVAIIKFNDFYKGAGFDNTILLNNRYDTVSNAYGIIVHPRSYDPSAPLDTSKEIFVARYGNARIADSSTFVHINTWYVVAFTYDGSLLKLYVNGELRNSRAVTTTLDYNGYMCFIGGFPPPSLPFSFNGVIDEVREYSKALSGDYIRQFNKLTQ